jgi:dihydrofolate synthase/folylpolyglutamate synthase
VNTALQADDPEQLLTHLVGPAQRIELGLERMEAAMARLNIPRQLPFPVVTVAGTNGKGSVVAYLEALALQASYRCAAYTSPHLWEFRERLRIDGQPLANQRWTSQIEMLGERVVDIPLTYFELSTLAALRLCLEETPDLAILEVGLGGRLDAVNAVDADLAVITSIDLDHQQFLGPDRESIGREKAGICRRGRPLLYGDTNGPCSSVMAAATACGAELQVLGRDFFLTATGEWRSGSIQYAVPPPLHDHPGQYNNLGLALAAAARLQKRLPRIWPPSAQWQVPIRLLGRKQWLRPWGAEGPRLLVDVAHNPQATCALAELLARAEGQVWAYWGMMADKDLAAAVAPLRGRASGWTLLAMPENARAAAPAQLRTVLGAAADADEIPLAELAPHLAKRAASLRPDDILLCFGSFQVLSALPRHWFPD